MTTYNTGNPLGSSAAKDMYDNAQNLDHRENDAVNETWPDRLGRDRLMWHGMEEQYKRTLASLGWIIVESFQSGATLTLPNQALKDEVSGEYYRWDGSLPKLVPTGSTPDTTGGVGAEAWVSVGDASVRPWVSQNFEEAEYKKLQNVSFATGTTIINADEVLFNAATAFYYQYKGALPVTVAPGSSPDSNWRCVGDANYPLTVESFGAVPFTVLADGSVPVTAVSASGAFQLMFDSLNYIKLERGNHYLITNPVQLHGYFWKIEGSKGFVHKKSTETTGITTPIKVGSFYALMDVNCAFITIDNARYWKISDIDVLVNEAPLDNRPACFYLPTVVAYEFDSVNTRGGLYSYWFKNGWQGQFKNCRANEEIMDSWFYDDARVSSSGSAISNTDQSATSIIFDKTYSNQAGRYSYHLRNTDYMTFVNGASDHAGTASYRFHQSQINGAMNAETTRFNVTAASAQVRIYNSAFYDGVSSGLGINNCVINSFLSIEISRDAGAFRVWTNGVAEELRESTVTYNSGPATLSPYATKIARISMPSSGTSLSIPLTRIKEIFPNFNKLSGIFVEYLKVKVINGNGVASGAVVAMGSNAIVGLDLTGQKVLGNGSATAVVSNISTDGTNLIITFTASIGSGAIVELSYM